MSSKQPRASRAKPRSRSGAGSLTPRGSFIEWLPLLILLVAGTGIWVGCHKNPVTPEDATYRTSGDTGSTRSPRTSQEPARATVPDKPIPDINAGDGRSPAKGNTSDDNNASISSKQTPTADKYDASTPNTSHDEPTGTRPAQPSGEVSSVPNAKGMIALTFDAGASAEPVADILRALANSGSHATFFFTGKWVKKNPETAKSIVAAGHEIANHSWSHPDFTTLTDDEMLDQLNQTQRMFQSELGTPGAALFRPPFGARNKEVREFVASHGYRIIYWAVDCLDSVKKDITPEQIQTRVMERSEQGDIVLMHCGSQPTAQALPTLIASLNKKGLRVVTVSELLKYE